MHTILDWISHTTVDVIRDHGVWAVFFLMVLESACIPAPSEVIMLFAGYLVWKHDASFWMMVTAGVTGNIVGSWIAWAVGAYGGRTYLERHGKWLHISHERLARADRWFERWGPATVFFTRMLPIIRTFISLPAGIARMPIGRFTVYTAIGCVPWVAMLTYVGVRMGDKWDEAHEIGRKFDEALAVLIVVGVVFLIVRQRRSRGLN